MCMLLAHKKKKPVLLPGEHYPGQIAANKKRARQIYKERLATGATYRQLSIKHGGLSGAAVGVIFHKEKRRVISLLLENRIRGLTAGKIGIEKFSPPWYELYWVEEEKIEKQIAENKKRFRGKKGEAR